MPFCPKCRFEYREGVEVCPDCNLDLVASLPPEDLRKKDDWRRRKGEPPTSIPSPDEDDTGWIALARLTSLQSAEMIIELLQEKDIPAVINSGVGYFGQIGSMGPSSYRPVGGGYTIMVPEESAEDADLEAEAVLGEEWAKARLIDFED